MAGLSLAQGAVLAQVLERAPDRMLDALSGAVASMPGERAASLGVMIAEEALDRRRRAIAFAPLLPLFRPRADGVEGLSFPAFVLPRLWKAASRKEADVLPILDDYRPIEDSPRMRLAADRLCLAAAAAVRDQPEIVWPFAGADPATRARGLDELARCFDLAAMARRALLSLPDLVLRPSEDQLAELRLLIRDGAGMAPDGGPRMLEILFAHLGDAWLILRLVAHASNASIHERLLSGSEMACFVNRLIAEVERRVARITAHGSRDKVDPGSGLRADIAWCAETLGELDRTLKLDPEGAWGQKAREARERINRSLAATLRSLDRTLDQLMPTRPVRTAGRMAKQVADLEAETAPRETVQAAIVQLSLVGALRTAAQVFGCEAQRRQLVQTTTERIVAYVDEVIEGVNAGDAPDQRRSLALVETLAKCLLLIDQDEAARTIRRRAGAAGARPVEAATIQSTTIQASPRAA